MTPLDIYKAYPRQIARLDALKAIEKAVVRLMGGERDGTTLTRSYALATLMKAVAEYARSTCGKEREFIPYPATWFNRGQYLDEPEIPAATEASLGMYRGPDCNTPEEWEQIRQKVNRRTN